MEDKEKKRQEYLKEYYKKNKEKFYNQEKKQEYYEKNKKKIKTKSNTYYKNKKMGTYSQSIELFLENE
jgi:hypothetical protein